MFVHRTPSDDTCQYDTVPPPEPGVQTILAEVCVIPVARTVKGREGGVVGISPGSGGAGASSVVAVAVPTEPLPEAFCPRTPIVYSVSGVSKKNECAVAVPLSIQNRNRYGLASLLPARPLALPR